MESSKAAPSSEVNPPMENLIPIINKLQDVLNATGADTTSIDLPQIVVIGSQSSGKSSVLETIVGRDFLPRGSGICTRRPLVLQLINLPAGSKKTKKDAKFSEWGEFLHRPNELFYNFEEIREEIQRETDRLTGRNKGISSTAINLKIYSPHVLNLTLVDLPGMTRVPVGEQPPDIGDQIRGMILTYISKPNAVILAVSAANSDLATSDALQLAREVDPEGLRTLGVITKLDIMDKGTDALDMLMGRVYPLRLGFIGVVNRSQQDIITKKPIKDALKSEREFFASNPLYRSIANRSGCAFLAHQLNKILMRHIRDCLPDLKIRVNKLMSDAQQELLSYGDPLLDNRNSQGALLLQILTKFAENYRNAIEGTSNDLALHELQGGARINYIFNEIYSTCLDHIQPNDGVTMSDIRTAIRNATGPRAALFVPEISFELLVKRQISRLEEPSLQCVDLAFDELQRIVSQLEMKDLARFAQLRERVVDTFNSLLHNCRIPTKKMIANLICIEMAYVNTNHPDFLGGGAAINQILEKMAMSQANEQQQTSTWGGISNPQQGQQQRGMPSSQHPQQNQQSGQVPTGKPGPQNPQGSIPGQGPEQNQGYFNIFFGGKKDQQSRQQPGQPAAQSRQSRQRPSRDRDPRSRSQRQGRADRLDQVPQTIKAVATPTDKEMFEIELIQSLLISYFNIVRKNIKDSVPKAIMHFLVNSSKESLQNELVKHLYKEELFDELLEESPQIAAKRKQCRENLEVLKRANAILNEVRDNS